KLLAYAGRRLDREAARDAVSEAMARAVARIERFAWEGGGFDAWIFGILRHVVLDAQRSRPAGAQDGEADETESAEPGPLDHVLGAERATFLRAAFRELSAADQEVLEL